MKFTITNSTFDHLYRVYPHFKIRIGDYFYCSKNQIRLYFGNAKFPTPSTSIVDSLNSTLVYAKAPGFWLTRSMCDKYAELWFDTSGVSKYKDENYVSFHKADGEIGMSVPAELSKAQCEKIFGFFPKTKEIWHVKYENKNEWKKKKIELEIISV